MKRSARLYFIKRWARGPQSFTLRDPVNLFVTDISFTFCVRTTCARGNPANDG